MPPKYNAATPVIFRMLNGECVAILPTLPWNGDPNQCTSYMHVGQHGACDIRLGQRARLATRAEYMPLKKELQRIGYKLHVVKRIAAAHNTERHKAIAGFERMGTSNFYKLKESRIGA